MRIRFCLLVGFVLAVLTPASVQAQSDDFTKYFSAYSGDNAPGYLQPAAEVLTASLHTGFFRPVPSERGFTIRLGVDLATSFISDEQKTFAATTPEDFSTPTTTDAPTVFGPTDPVVVDGEGGFQHAFPGGFAVEGLTLPVPRLTVGSFYGTEATVRGYTGEVSALGDVSFLGVGLRHNISQYLPAMPVDLGVGGLHHTLNFGDVADVSALLVGLEASVTRGVLGVYGGLGYETSTADVRYTRSDDSAVAIDVEGVNGLRATAGVALDLPVVALYADATSGSQTVVNLGIALGY